MKKLNNRVKRLATTSTLALLALGISLPLTAAAPDTAHAQAQVNNAAEAEIRFQQLEKELRRLTGQVEQQQYDLRQLREKVSKLTDSQNARQVQSLAPANGVISTSENYGNNTGSLSQDQNYDQGVYTKLSDNGGVSMGAHSTSHAQPIAINNNNKATPTENKEQTAVIQASTGATGSAAKDYDRAYAYIKTRDFENAEKSFAAFMKKYPQSTLLPNAKYWYAETFYVRGDYEHAARTFAEGYQQFPKGSKAPSNLLKLGMSLVGMNKPDDACIAFKQLRKDYAQSAIPVLKRAQIEMKKINCQ